MTMATEVVMMAVTMVVMMEEIEVKMRTEMKPFI